MECVEDFEGIVYEDEYLHIYGWLNGRAIEILKTEDEKEYKLIKQELYLKYGFGKGG